MGSLALPRKYIALYTLGKTGNATPYSFKVMANFNNLAPNFVITAINEKIGNQSILVDPAYYTISGTTLVIKRWGPIKANRYNVVGNLSGRLITVTILPQKLGS